MTTGERIRLRRKELDISAESLAEKLGVSPSTIYRYENGDIEKCPSYILEPLADYLRTTPAYLMGWEDPSAEHTDIPAGFMPLPRMVKKPLVGAIACGEPITAEENIEDYVDVPENVRCDFCLLCRGDSMIDANIHDGDIVYIRSGVEIHNGEICAVRIGDEATLKRVYLDREHSAVTLVPANSQYAPLTYTGEDLADVHIEGRAVGFTHLF